MSDFTPINHSLNQFAQSGASAGQGPGSSFLGNLPPELPKDWISQGAAPKTDTVQSLYGANQPVADGQLSLGARAQIIDFFPEGRAKVNRNEFSDRELLNSLHNAVRYANAPDATQAQGIFDTLGLRPISNQNAIPFDPARHLGTDFKQADLSKDWPDIKPGQSIFKQTEPGYERWASFPAKGTVYIHQPGS